MELHHLRLLADILYNYRDHTVPSDILHESLKSRLQTDIDDGTYDTLCRIGATDIITDYTTYRSLAVVYFPNRDFFNSNPSANILTHPEYFI